MSLRPCPEPCMCIWPMWVMSSAKTSGLQVSTDRLAALRRARLGASALWQRVVPDGLGLQSYDQARTTSRGTGGEPLAGDGCENVSDGLRQLRGRRAVGAEELLEALERARRADGHEHVPGQQRDLGPGRRREGAGRVSHADDERAAAHVADRAPRALGP